jgi:hypothetical protein
VSLRKTGWRVIEKKKQFRVDARDRGEREMRTMCPGKSFKGLWCKGKKKKIFNDGDGEDQEGVFKFCYSDEEK